MITAVIPAFNEGKRIVPVLKQTRDFVDEIIVVDDCSSDNTAEVAQKYAKVLRNKTNKGYIFSIKKGFQQAKNNIIVTLDADGDHNPKDIPRLVEPIIKNQADLVLGVRKNIPRFSERILNRLTNIKVKTRDCGTGFRAIKKELATKLKLKGACTCGIFVLEAHSYGARVQDAGIQTKIVDKKRWIAFKHFKQFFTVLSWIIFRS